jgi:dynactin complex subunit
MVQGSLSSGKINKGGIMGSSSDSGCVVQRKGQISTEENRLHESCDELRNKIEELDEVLSNIMGANDLNKTASPAPPEEQLVSLANSIREARKSVKRSIERINSIILRIEL